jgi:hypothetical protein
MPVSAILLTSVELAIWCNLHNTTFWEQLCLITSWLRTLLWSSTTCVPLIRRPTKIQVVSDGDVQVVAGDQLANESSAWIICLLDLIGTLLAHFIMGVIFYKSRNMHLGSTDFFQLPTAVSCIKKLTKWYVCCDGFYRLFVFWGYQIRGCFTCVIKFRQFSSMKSPSWWCHDVIRFNHKPFPKLPKYSQSMGPSHVFSTAPAEATFCVPGTRPKKNAGLTSPSSPGAHLNNGEMAQMWWNYVKLG